MSDHSIIDVNIDISNQYHIEYSDVGKYNILVTGGNASGKSRLTMGVADFLQKLGWIVQVVDCSQAWQKKSSIPFVKRVKPRDDIYLDVSVIYDVSHLLLEDRISFVDELTKAIWYSRVGRPDAPKLLLIIEEAQIYFKRIDSKGTQYCYQLLTIGRNYAVRMAMITPRPQDIHPLITAVSNIRYFGRMSEPNALNKIHKMIDPPKTRTYSEMAKTLQVGQFLHITPSHEILKIQVPCFESESKPRPISKKIRRTPMGPSMPDLEEYDIPHNPMGGIMTLLFLLSIAIIIKLLIA